MIRLNNDYCRGALPCVMKALTDDAANTYPGYGRDSVCDEAADMIRKLCSCPDADVHFFAGATQANFVAVAAALTSVESVIAADTGHINVHEAGSIENTCHKIQELPNSGGKISAAQIRGCVELYHGEGDPEYYTEPKMVYISFPTEQGTLYSLSELREISAICREFGLYLFVDGARMAYGLASPVNDVTPADLASLADVFYFGGTKCGALFGEALVITNSRLKPRFKAYMKQNGAVLAKGWLLGLQFRALLESGEYFSAAAHADELALKIRKAFEDRGIPLWADSPTNQQFVILSDAQKEKLSENFISEDQGRCERGNIVRFCTSWATSDEEADALIREINAL